MIHLKATLAHLTRIWQTYFASTRHQHEFGEHGECNGCGKILGDW